MEYTIDKKTLELILNYLAQRPWAEVQPIMQEIVRAKPVAKPQIEEKVSEETQEKVD